GSDEPRQEIESHRAVERLCAPPTSISGPNLQQVFGPQVFRSRVFRSQVFGSQVFWSQVFGSRIFMSKSLGNEAQQGLDAARARKTPVRQGRSRQAQLFSEDALEDRAQIGRGLEIPPLVQLFIFEAGPVGYDAAALDGAANQEGDRSG